MHRDPTLRKRNALVIPGVLLALLCLAGVVYAQALRPDSVDCEDGRMVVFAGACRSATLLLAVPLALGLLLVVLGARLRGHNTCHLGHGTVATTGLAVLVTAFAVPLLLAVGLYLTQDPDEPYVITYNDVDFGQARILAAVAAGMGLLLLPYLLLYLGTGRPRKCCRDKGCFEPCFCDEDTVPPAPTFPPVESPARPMALPPAPPLGETAQVTTVTWSGPPPRDARPMASAGPAREDATPLPPAPKEDPPRPLMHDAWPETHHDSTFDQAPPAPAPAAPEPMPAPEAEPAAAEEPAKGKAAKKPAKTRKVTGSKKKR